LFAALYPYLKFLTKKKEREYLNSVIFLAVLKAYRAIYELDILVNTINF